MSNLKISASLLSCDFGRIQEEVIDICNAGVDLMHIDVMDGHFVPNITLGPDIVRVVKKNSSKPLDVHLMINDVKFYAPKFAEAGADIITFHIESIQDSLSLAKYIKSLGVKVGVSLVPNTPASAIEHLMNEVDLILVMTVNPGFANQSFMSEQLDKISEIRDMIDKSGRQIDLSVDGGINNNTAKECIKAGANVLVSGSYIFSDKTLEGYRSKINSLRA